MNIQENRLGINNNIFQTNIPIDNDLKKYLATIVRRLSHKYKHDDILNIHKILIEFEKKLFAECREFSNECLFKVILPHHTEFENVRFIFRIDLKNNWYGQFIVKEDKIRRRIISMPINGTDIAKEKNHIEISQHEEMRHQEYLLIKMILDFNDFYMKYGRIFPAHINIILRDNQYDYLSI